MNEKISYFRVQRKKKQFNTLTTVKRSNKVIQALSLPKIMNLNPRSAMNKIEELTTFIIEEDIDVSFISESHDRENKRLEHQFN